MKLAQLPKLILERMLCVVFVLVSNVPVNLSGFEMAYRCYTPDVAIDSVRFESKVIG